MEKSKEAMLRRQEMDEIDKPKVLDRTPVGQYSTKSCYLLREAAKTNNSIFSSGPATKASSLVVPEFFLEHQKTVFFLSGHKYFPEFFLEHQKTVFCLSGQALTPPPLLVAGLLKKRQVFLRLP